MYVGMYNSLNPIVQPDAVVNWSDNFGATGNRLRINFTINNGAISGASSIPDIDREMESFWPDRSIGVGDFINFTTGPKSHLHLHNAFGANDFMEFTNTSTLGGNTAPFAAGFHIGMSGSLAQIAQFENNHLIAYTNVSGGVFAERMRITHVGAPGVPNPGGGVFNNSTRIGIPLNPSLPVTDPLSLLHLGFNEGPSNGGWRPWMANGMLVSQGTDNVFIGLKDENAVGTFNDRYDAVINWGDNNFGLPGFAVGPDNLRFIFTAPAGVGSPEVSLNGLEVARLTPSCLTCPINKPSFGIGNFAPSGTQGPGTPGYIGATLDVDGDARIRKVTHNDSFTRVLVIDPLDSNRVHWRDASTITPGGGGGILNAQNGLHLSNPSTVDLGGNLLYNTNIELANFSFLYQNTGIGRWAILPGGQLVSNITGTGINGGYRLDIANHEQGILLALNNGLGNAVGMNADVIGTNAADGTYITASSNGTVNGHRVVLVSNGTDKSAFNGYVTNGNNAYGLQVGVLNADRSYGVHSVVDNNLIPTTEMYGIYTKAAANIGATNVYGIYAEAPAITNSWAGYFAGNVNITSQLFVSGLPITSDQQFKTEIDTIANASQIIAQLTPRTFFFDTTNIHGFHFSNERQYGFVAQEVEPILPELVTEVIKPISYDSAGNVVDPALMYKALNYNGMIALLMKGMQEQQSTIENLTNQVNNLTAMVNNCCNQENSLQGSNSEINRNQDNYAIVRSTDVRLTDTYCVLGENSPNPFRDHTTINFNLSETIQSAQIVFYNSIGQVIKVLEINDRGEGRLNVYGEDLRSGMYTYSLIIDGNVCETKKMIKE